MPNTELAELIRDVKEQALFMQELGVEAFDVRLPEFVEPPIAESKPKIVATDKSVRAPMPEGERYVPTAPPVIPKVEKPEPKRPAGSRLAALPSLSKRSPKSAGTKEPIVKQPETIITPETLEEPDRQRMVASTDTPAMETIEEIRLDIGNCTRCELHQGRTKIVHSTGNFEAQLMFVGEAPGADEDALGEPFVGRAGQLLTKIIEGMGYKREQVFIGNINRCRPPGNRAPTLPEAETCKPFLLREIAVVKPKVIVVLGNTACQNLLSVKTGITKLRGNFHDYFGVKVMPTFHPAYLLRDPHKKREVWEDMKKVRDYLNSAG